jgi:multidrug efflux pump subunit AcrA (membrane-fusion protein)
LVLCVTGCGEPDSPQEREIPVAQAERRDIREEIRLSGDIAPAFQVEIKPEVGGKLREVHASTGQDVKKGDLLFVIDDSDLQIERASAQVEIDGARVSVEKLAGNLGRARELFEAKLISKEVYENLDADHRLAENALQRAQRRLETVDDRITNDAADWKKGGRSITRTSRAISLATQRSRGRKHAIKVWVSLGQNNRRKRKATGV